ncbi:hypothetical protein DOY81_008733 [Sarcophaga bullata]|nr:hypothetical protein DOY81_008733 [Sarcophaga bullata]
MSFFRSEPMTLCQMVLHSESAFNCLIELGYVGKVQFLNIYAGSVIVNNRYTAEIQRCNELKRIITYLQQQIDDFDIKVVIYPDVDEDEIPEAADLKTLETILQRMYDDLMQVVMSVETLRRQRQEIHEHLLVLQKAEAFFGQPNQPVIAWTDSFIMNLMKNELLTRVNGVNDGMHLSFVTGTIPVQRFATFETILWRITRGYFVLKNREVTVKVQQTLGREESYRKYVFIIFFMGPTIKKKIAKVSQGFGIKLFECPESLEDRKALVKSLSQELKDLDMVIEKTQKHRYNLLLIASADLYIWQTKVQKMLMVYFIMNRMNHVKRLQKDKYLQADCWIPSREVNNVRDALILGARRTAKGNARAMFVPMLNEIYKPNLTDNFKPTYFVLNRFTKGFQNLIDAYGMAQYQELNPAPYTIITFPFLFAVMFGDCGHGLIMFLFGLWMVLKEKPLEEQNRLAKEQSEIWNILFAGRYIITLMGGFSIYTGLIYNDTFSKAFNLFGTAWRVPFTETEVLSNQFLELDPANPKHYLGTPYVFGMDPIWDASGEHAIIMFNSLKMKLAIILGVAQMIFGLLLSAANFIHKDNYVDLLLVFVPQIIFLLCIFGYLVFLVFFKWVAYGGHIDTPYNSACAPSVLIIFINMLLMKGADEPPENCEIYMFEFQNYIQMCLLAFGLLCIPILLAGKPIYFTIQKRKIQKIQNESVKRSRKRHTLSNIRKSLVYMVEEPIREGESELPRLTKHKEEDETVLSELWIHSGIHCIESVLGAVSHTASYLRLWALSLAHDQLSTVLWNMVLKVGLTGSWGYGNAIVIYLVFIFWAALTVAILVVMEGLSAFLHCLRLHWVEFQSKFYAGSGEAFQPFEFKRSSPSNTT